MGVGDYSTQTRILEVVHGRVGNLEDVVLVAYGISLALPGFLYQSKIDRSMKNSKLFSEIPYFFHFYHHILLL